MKIFKSKKIIVIFIVFIVLVASFISFSLYYKYSVEEHPFKKGIGDVTLTVKNGDNLHIILDTLNNENCFNNIFLIKVYVKNKGIDLKDLRPGVYAFKSDTTLSDFFDKLSNHKYASKNTVIVIIPEGYTIDDIAKTLDASGVISKHDFISACKSYTLPSYITVNSKRKYQLEGFLFPDTYELKKKMSGNDIVKLMLTNFDAVISDIQKKENISIKSENLDKTIIMASIVEKEIKAPEERALAASVFYNRLKINMNFGSCATVEYALGYHKEKLSNKDTQINSPFNTYIVKGYPAGPIASPGRAAIIAALKPASTDYLYFVSKNDGTHFFTKSYSEFEKAKAKYQGNK